MLDREARWCLDKQTGTSRIVSRFCRSCLPWLGAFALWLLPTSTLHSSTTLPAPGYPEPQPEIYPAHYIVFTVGGDDQVQPVAYRLIQSQTPLVSLPAEAVASHFQQRRSDTRRFVVGLVAATGQSLYQTVVEIPAWVRAEFPDEAHASGESTLVGYYLLGQPRSFAVRLPAWDQADPRATLAVQEVGTAHHQHFALQALIRTAASQPQASSTPQLTTQRTGSSANRVDLLIMGDGYSALEQSKFISDSTKVVDGFFTISPYANYRNYFNVHFLYTPSSESGADHPPYDPTCASDSCCADAAMQYDTRQNIFVDTAFDARYCTGNIHRALTVDGSKVLAAAAAVPEWDQILVLVNDATWGGTGGSISVIAANEATVGVAQHEFGHSFVQLADEYEYLAVTAAGVRQRALNLISCSDEYPFFGTCPANITEVTDRAKLKWSPWVSPTTPIPTVPEYAFQFADVVGLFEGALYQSTTYYRSGQACLMRTLGAPFCPVPSQAFVLRLYAAGWGVPQEGIRLIEPGQMTPLTPTLALTYPHTITFHIEPLQPIGEPPVQIRWMVNGLPVPGAISTTYTFTPSQPFTQVMQVVAQVRDVTPLVHPALVGDQLQTRHTWFILPGEEVHNLYLPIIHFLAVPFWGNP